MHAYLCPVTLEDREVPGESGAQVAYLRRVAKRGVRLTRIERKEYGKQGFRAGCDGSKMWRNGQEQERDVVPHVLLRAFSAEPRRAYIGFEFEGEILLSWKADEPEYLHAHVARVKTAGDRRVGGALDDGATIRKNGELVRIDAGAHGEIIGAHVG